MMTETARGWSRDSPFVWVLRDAEGRRTAGYCIRWLDGSQYCGMVNLRRVGIGNLSVAKKAVEAEMRTGEVM